MFFCVSLVLARPGRLEDFLCVESMQTPLSGFAVAQDLSFAPEEGGMLERRVWKSRVTNTAAVIAKRDY